MCLIQQNKIVSTVSFSGVVQHKEDQKAIVQSEKFTWVPKVLQKNNKNKILATKEGEAKILNRPGHSKPTLCHCQHASKFIG